MPERPWSKLKMRGSPAYLVALLVCGIPACALAAAFGAGHVAMMSALVSLFTFASIRGGSLRADLKVAAAVAPLIFFGAIVPRLVSEWDATWGAVAACAFILIVVLLPLWGKRLGTARMGAGLAVIYSYAMNLGEFGAGQFVFAILMGVTVPVLVRIVVGSRDPHRQTREGIAAILEDRDPDVASALHAWMLDGRRLWQARALSSACRYRAGDYMLRMLDRGASDGQALDFRWKCRRAAAVVARQIRAKEPDRGSTLEWPEPGLPGDRGHAARVTARGLRDAFAAATERPIGKVAPLPRESTRGVSGRPLLRVRQVQLRHAARTFASMCIMVALVTWLLPQGSALAATTLVCTFAILQTSWQGTLSKVKTRVIGVASGLVAAAILTAALPQEALLPLGLASLLLSLWFRPTAPVAARFFLVLMSVGISVGTRGVDPASYIAEYLVLIAAAIAVGLLGGFALVRPAPHPTLAQSVDTAWSATLHVLEGLGENGGRLFMVTGALTEFDAALKELKAEHSGATTKAAHQREVDDFATSCLALVLCGIDEALAESGDLDALLLNARKLDFTRTPEDMPPTDSFALSAVAQAQRAGARLLQGF